MSLAFELQIAHEAVRPARRLARAVFFVAVLALGLAGHELLGSAAAWPMVAGAAAVAAAFAARRTAPAAALGVLRVSREGVIGWAPASDDADPRGAASPGGSGDGALGTVALHRWQFAPRFAWLELRPALGGRAVRLVLARSAVPAAQWAALGRWLTWVGRARTGQKG